MSVWPQLTGQTVPRAPDTLLLKERSQMLIVATPQ